ncbi:hypothetical protein Rsub_00760 [Raphidocelis subcapitata]|uniref:U-box domain-containing protein n=1 Tax=Raphidocelis subcapitata TaxID=307507 RepID=A0A2V0NL04_9CHLO|nr:hypothetical protein Rsub_00760 [Raphidocelis subcapitata]|eukprot:GBF88048.1 hypothetical protein Rsub_00760 [Raphidocelis subcapitata]
MRRGPRFGLLVLACFTAFYQEHLARTQWASGLQAAGQGSSGPAVYDGASAASTPLLSAVQGRMHWHAAGGGAFVTPPLPVYPTPAALVQAHPRAAVWLLTACLATPRFAAAAFGRVPAWRGILGMLELQASLPALPILDARPGVPADAVARAGMQAVCLSPPAPGGGGTGGGGGGGGGQQQRWEQGQGKEQQQQQQKWGQGEQQQQRRRQQPQGQEPGGAESDEQQLCEQQQLCRGSERPSSLWRGPLRPRWWRQQLRRLSPRQRAADGGGAAPPPPAPLPFVNCTVWTRDGRRVASFAVTRSPPSPPPPPATWRNRAAASCTWAGGWLAWLLWPRWRLLQLLPLLRPELGWVATSALVAGIKAQFSELCFLAAALPPVLAARDARHAAQTLAYFCVGITVLLLWEAHQQVAAELLFTWPLIRWLYGCRLANLWLASWHSARAWFVLVACLLPDGLQARAMQPLSWIWWLRQLAARLQGARPGGGGAREDAAGARRAETARAQAQRYQELRDYYEHAATRALSEAGLPVARLRLPSEQRWPAELSVPECVDELDSDAVPRGFVCPITQMVMRQPAMLISTEIETPATYERSAIQDWLRSNRVDPRSRTRVGDDGRLVPNLELHRAIEDFCAMHARAASRGAAGGLGGGAGAAGGGGVGIVEAVSAAAAQGAGAFGGLDGGGGGGAAGAGIGPGGGGGDGSGGGARRRRQPSARSAGSPRGSAGAQARQPGRAGERGAAGREAAEGGLPFMDRVMQAISGEGHHHHDHPQGAGGAGGGAFVFQAAARGMRRRLTARRSSGGDGDGSGDGAAGATAEGGDRGGGGGEGGDEKEQPGSGAAASPDGGSARARRYNLRARSSSRRAE